MDRDPSSRLPWVPTDDLWRRLAENVEDTAIILLDPSGQIASWNRGAEKLKGYTAEEIVGRSFSIFYPEEAVDIGHPHRELEAAAAIGRYSEEGWRVRKDGSRFWAEVTITAIYSDDGSVQGYGKLTRDLTSVKQTDEQRTQAIALLEATALIDSLTGLANRRAWDDTLEREVARAERGHGHLCVAMIDLDHFKAYNDEHGHRAGDQFLRRCSVIWRGTLRPSDLLARYGGEEFALCLPGCDCPEAAEVLGRLRRLTPNDQTCSAGVAAWQPDEPADWLFDRADQALYQAKTAGRNRTVLAPGTASSKLRIAAAER